MDNKSQRKLESKIPQGKLRFSQANLGMAPNLKSTNTKNSTVQLGNNQQFFEELFSKVLDHPPS